MPKGKEIKRRFLVGDFCLHGDIAYNIAKRRFRSTLITQGYILDEKKTRLRLENENGVVKCFHTWEKGKGVRHKENEEEISKEDFLRKWKKIAFFLIRECYFIEFRNIKQTFELNSFEYYVAGVWQSFWLVEVKFKSSEESRAFVPPSMLGGEITDKERYNSYSLARYGLPKEDA